MYVVLLAARRTALKGLWTEEVIINYFVKYYQSSVNYCD